MEKFKQQLTKTVAEHNNVSVTENGAIGFKTTTSKLLDMNFKLASYRHLPDKDIEFDFSQAYAENPMYAMRWLFFSRDPRGGAGERRFFRVAMRYMAREFPDVVRKVMPLIQEYGRWDDLFSLFGTNLEKDMITLVGAQLRQDMERVVNKEASISLLGKWMPSLTASSKETKERARKFVTGLNVTPMNYQKMLSALRLKLDVVERKMSSREWQKITYEHVPSKANLNYNSAFLRNDTDRRKKFLESLSKGETKINAGVLFPHDIVHKYCENGLRKDDTLEGLWKALPDLVQGDESTIVVADGSGSMTSRIGKDSKVSALEVANALAIYFAERCNGAFKDTYITFSENPQIVNMRGASTLAGKIQTALKHNEVANTNIEAVFTLILETAVKNKMRQDELPKNILIISDMEFDSCATTSTRTRTGWGYSAGRPDKTLFGVIAKRFKDAGYQLPRLVFWNVNSRTGTIPVKNNDLGVALVSGFSPNLVKMVMSNKLDPLAALIDVIMSERYNPVEVAIKS